ncbi:Protein tesmin/TSO1-like CXC 6 [Galdieria sulphuraria]|uniref:Tesmin/TSO1-like CXC domain-containing protein n=1 Tax=Galdieria sulphuraria TaxID=130081 RepID=M2WSH9_GALSU|nr:tesmin/TSO1-like CXC domain-containing protein [Galdieria sulphuraria]EME26815.1 tesmin/TSO1-like CXC domain-containing protein [Galdieria sulphuraria]GJD11296.1 Protein tesmin/TSO1-like CXC 6 [Galdieria sulphuraria]|eukprot:XP_005703335.1 tesmin/TSO1-like CXC domain-containing protein [Galdieria sulphuraria]
MEPISKDDVYGGFSTVENCDSSMQCDNSLLFGDLQLSPITSSVKPSPAKSNVVDSSITSESFFPLALQCSWFNSPDDELDEDTIGNKYILDPGLTPERPNRDTFFSINSVTPIHQMTFGSPFSKHAHVQSFSYRSFSISGSNELESARAKLNQIFEETPTDDNYDETIEETFSSLRKSNSSPNELRAFDFSKLHTDERHFLKRNITLRWKRKQALEASEGNKSLRETEHKQTCVESRRTTSSTESTERDNPCNVQFKDELDLFDSSTPDLESSSSSILEDASGSTPFLIENSTSYNYRRTRQPLLTLNNKLNVGSNPCNCKRSQCLKLYCECFASGSYCTSKCKCNGCKNNGDNANHVKTARERTLERNPRAFSPKISESTAAVTEEGQVLRVAAHHRGCNCKRSNCRKKYCECFQAGVPCGDNCKCVDCKNQSSLSLLKNTAM